MSCEGLHLEDVFSLPLTVYLNKQVSIPFFFFSHFVGVALIAIIFSMRKGGNLARQTSSTDSMTMNLESLPFHSLILIDFLCFFWLDDTISDVYIFAGSVLCHHPPQSPTCVGEGPFALVEMGIHYQYTQAGSRILSPCNFRFLVDITNYHVF